MPLFYEALRLAQSDAHRTDEHHPAVTLLTDWWNAQGYPTEKAALFDLIIRPDLSKTRCFYVDSEIGSFTHRHDEALPRSKASRASVGDHILVIFLQSEVQRARAEPGSRLPLLTVAGDDYGGALLTAEELGDDGEWAPRLLGALRRFASYFPPSAWASKRSKATHPILSEPEVDMIQQSIERVVGEYEEAGDASSVARWRRLAAGLGIAISSGMP